jgi:Cu/Ag efflux protein CusF
MDRTFSKTVSAAILAASLPFFAGCASMQSSAQSIEPGAVAVETAEMDATVKSVDMASRTVTLVGAHGKRATYKIGKGAINFDRIRPGDKVRVTVTEALAVYLRPQGTPASVGEGAAVALAPKGAMPGGFVADTAEVTAKVVSVDAATRHVTLRLPNGKLRQLNVNPSVDLSKVKAGDAVTAQVADSLAISVAKP